MAVDWTEVTDQVKQALSELGIDDPMNQRAYVIVQLWRQRCPSCMPQDENGKTNYYVIKASVKDIDSGNAVACACQPYLVTRDIYESLCSAQAQLPQLPSAPRCGYGWCLFDAQGNPIFYEGPVPGPTPSPVPPPPTTTTTTVTRAPAITFGQAVFGTLVLAGGAFLATRAAK